MRVIYLRDDSDLKAVQARLGGHGGANLRGRLAALNPHVDLNRIGAGTVLLLPDGTGVADGDADIHAIGAASFAALAGELKASFAQATARARDAAASLGAEREAVAAAFKSDLVQRLARSDAAFRRQIDDVEQASAADAPRLREAADRIDALGRVALDELAALAKRFGGAR